MLVKGYSIVSVSLNCCNEGQDSRELISYPPVMVLETVSLRCLKGLTFKKL